MPFLQTHMVRVAGVATIICQGWEDEIESNNIISACLLHDVGNIIKFKLGAFPDTLEPQGLVYWQKIQDLFKEEYSEDEHEASYKIAEEIGVDDRVMELIKSVGFSYSVENYKHSDYPKKICAYSDHRVGLFAILSLEKRMQEGRKRFKINKGEAVCDKDSFMHYAFYMRKIEKQIFEKCKIEPGDINDDMVNEKIASLREWEL